ncbi:MAG: ABC transporter ATP-binding protein [Caldilineaceae bacterium]
MAKVICRNLYKRFGDGLAVNNVNLEVGEGEFLVIVGPSGCGKTTTLRMIAGLETISDGEILIDEQIVNDVEPRHRDIAMVFQNYALYPHKRVFDNIAYPLQLRRTARGEIKQRVHETAKLLGIEHLLDRRIRQLSGGERQRVALGRAIVRKPRLFLMDEPLSNLDADYGSKCAARSSACNANSPLQRSTSPTIRSGDDNGRPHCGDAAASCSRSVIRRRFTISRPTSLSPALSATRQ